MNENQFKEYEKVLDIQQQLILRLNALKEKRSALLAQVKKDKDMDKFDKEVFEMELEAEMLLTKMEENFQRIQKLQAELKTENK